MLLRALSVLSLAAAQLIAPLNLQPDNTHAQLYLQDVDHHIVSASPKAHRIAVIGAGAAGSSAAYHLSQFSQLNTNNSDTLPLNLSITIFERSSYVGGRSTTINALNDPRYPTELGASIFVDINAILYNATRAFGLPSNDKIYESTGADFDLGIWDGKSFVFTTAADDNEPGGVKWRLGGWWDVAKLLWKYGMSPIRLRSLQKATINKFLRMYESPIFPFSNLQNAADEVDLLDTTGTIGEEMLKSAGISERFAREIIQASSRVNYAQNLAAFHGLETMVCMSTQGAVSVEGGNWRIFDGMVERSGAELRLDTTVRSIEFVAHGSGSGSGTVIFTSMASSEFEEAERDEMAPIITEMVEEEFDMVVLAAPYDASRIGIHPKPKTPLTNPDYVTLYVTLFTTPYRPNPVFFGLPAEAGHLVPDSILTTLPDNPLLQPPKSARGVDAVGPTGFWSLSTLRSLHPSNDSFALIPDYLTSGHIPAENLAMENPQYLYKIFSPAPLTAEFMVDLFGWQDLEQHRIADEEEDEKQTENEKESARPIGDLPKELLTWSYEKEWQSYPYMPPTRKFEGFDVYAAEGEEELSGRLWHTSIIERFISTMETSALAGRNVARLIVDRLEGK